MAQDELEILYLPQNVESQIFKSSFMMMNMIPKVAAGILLAALAIPASAQRLKLTEGDLSVLKGQTEVNADFTYSSLKVGKFGNEDDYIQKKTEEYNKKESGKGDTWAKAWKDDRPSRYEPKFNELFSENSKTE